MNGSRRGIEEANSIVFMGRLYISAENGVHISPRLVRLVLLGMTSGKIEIPTLQFGMGGALGTW